MDTLTHALCGALLARASAPRPHSHPVPLGRRVFAGFFAAAFPDIDFVTSYLSPLAYLYHHRGITHSVLLLPLWAWLIALIFAAIWRNGPRWRAYWGVCALGVGSHIFTDWITSFGTMIFAPLSDARYALSATFIIDLWFTGIVLAGLIASLLWRPRRAPAVVAVVMLAGYVVFQWLLQQQAVEFGRTYARSIGVSQPAVSAMPRPVSPFNWTVIVDDGAAYHYAHVNLIRKTVPPEPNAEARFIARLDSAYRPLDRALWLRAARYGSTQDEVAFAHEAYAQTDFRFFRWFAAYPALVKTDRAGTEHCAWFHDLRFVTPGRDTTPFLYGMCRLDGRGWQAFQLGENAKALVY